MQSHEIVQQCNRLGLAPKLIRQVTEIQEQKRYIPSQKDIALLSGLGDRRSMLKAIEQYASIIDRHAIARAGSTYAHHNVKPTSAACSGEATMAPAGADSADDGDADGDGDGDGPRPTLQYVPLPPALPSRNSPRAVRRKSRPKSDLDVLMHTHALLALVFMFCVSLGVTFAFALLDFQGLALTCLGLTAGQGWALAGKLVSPK